ncbi:peptidylprolyl isomerase [Anaerosporobacter faecicola]|uniref:peptidylprolyl isomerase n=1 Tax=Anaerosporobacter faecicola TaxID=2718714 RepID=UPI00143B83EE|nr:peptidylprolyl isomerase [Anaerosporobacter faecicola]
MRKISKYVALVLVVAMAFAGCAKKDNNTVDKNSENTTTQTSEDETADSAMTEIKGSGSQFEEPQEGDTVAEIVVKDFGSIKVKFFADRAPKAVENFVTHAKEGYYDGLTFHRIINEFMIQGGDPMGTGAGGESIWGKNFEDEFSDDLHPYRGALCMANAGANTNGSQFFIVQTHPYEQEELEQILTSNGYELGATPLESFKIFMKAAYDCEFSDEVSQLYMEKGGTPWLFQAHTVFGQIYDEASYDTLDAIANTEMKDTQTGIPAEQVIIETIKITEYKK